MVLSNSLSPETGPEEVNAMLQAKFEEILRLRVKDNASAVAQLKPVEVLQVCVCVSVSASFNRKGSGLPFP